MEESILDNEKPAPENDDGWDKQESLFWNPEEGDAVEGEFLGTTKGVGENESDVYNIRTTDGKQVSVWSCKVLEGKMMNVKLGQQVKIRYIGKVKPEKGKEYKNYDLFTKPLSLSSPTA